MALYLTIYCKRKGKVLHLEDLYVREEFRSTDKKITIKSIYLFLQIEELEQL